MKSNKWKTLSSKITYKNPWFQIKENKVIKPNGKESKYSVVVTHPGVFVIAINTKKEIFLIKSQRYMYPKSYWEVPGGSTDGEKVLFSAKKELWEETGFKAKIWKKIGKFYPWPGITSEIDFVFLATDLTQTNENKTEEEGIQEIKAFTIPKVLDLIKTGAILDSQSITAIMQVLLFLNHL